MAEQASKEFPDTRIVVSTLLPRTDTPPHVIHDINMEIRKGCATYQMSTWPSTQPLAPGTSMMDSKREGGDICKDPQRCSPGTQSSQPLLY
ncbi:2-C-methyl-D-erythritol 4-phosphate cytidylyltransferase [Dissostichus eleginoides]|uniref:2-C-methyl-D-erythritol 4-phosphate cytidylyltransferase n=1 Tax=Dissostichus eleginoides TaxID=100907 RepID=A0AAD9CRF2_DISEL|nr:2-C-methyl-D-erythritol 4-phosphate cytidylyltransferase [Dissostichus eleginoides]